MCAIQTRAMTCVNLFQHVDLSKHHIHIVYIAPCHNLNYGHGLPICIYFYFLMVVDEVQVLLFELTNFFDVEFIRKEKGGLLLIVLIFRAKVSHFPIFVRKLIGAAPL